MYTVPSLSTTLIKSPASISGRAILKSSVNARYVKPLIRSYRVLSLVCVIPGQLKYMPIPAPADKDFSFSMAQSKRFIYVSSSAISNGSAYRDGNIDTLVSVYQTNFKLPSLSMMAFLPQYAANTPIASRTVIPFSLSAL